MALRNICGSHNRQRGSRLDISHRIPAIFHAVFVGRFGHDVPKGLVGTAPVFLEEGSPHIVAEPVARIILLGRVLNKSYALVVIVQPIHLQLAGRKGRI